MWLLRGSKGHPQALVIPSP
uniref:Actin-related protein 2/3 complex subunit 3 Arp2/3 complex 21 kDa subunit n=1 Tax=Rhizophora mucronata TaxID=61149 RepID=A0A2P2JSG7_RHIMU